MCLCHSLDHNVAPLLDRQEAPLVAIVDTSKITTQLLDALEEPIQLLIDDGFADRKKRMQKQLLDFEKKIEQKLNVLEKNANTEALSRTVTSLEKEIEDIKTPGKLNLVNGYYNIETINKTVTSLTKEVIKTVRKLHQVKGYYSVLRKCLRQKYFLNLQKKLMKNYIGPTKMHMNNLPL